MIDFWRRWHMTLSRFLRDYLYIPLGGGRRGAARRHVNLMITMLLGGLWHGAGWTFVIWGGLHGLYLVANHAWRAARARWIADVKFPAGLAVWLGRPLTFLAVVVAWVFFRAETLPAALVILEGMAGMNGVSKADPFWFGAPELRWLVVMFLVAWGLPNVQQLLHRYQPALETYPGEVSPPYWKRLAWRPAAGWSLVTAALLLVAVINLTRVSEFLYYQF
jgi:hypothetical protein